MALPIMVETSSPAVREPGQSAGNTRGKTITRLAAISRGALRCVTAYAAMPAATATAAAPAVTKRRDRQPLRAPASGVVSARTSAARNSAAVA